MRGSLHTEYLPFSFFNAAFVLYMFPLAVECACFCYIIPPTKILACWCVLLTAEEGYSYLSLFK